jgi:ornithine decarboxylase
MSIALISSCNAIPIAPDSSILTSAGQVISLGSTLNSSQLAQSENYSAHPADPANLIPSTPTSSNVTILQELLDTKIGIQSGPFYWVNLKAIEDKYHQWKRELPTVTPYYAVKCNPDPMILQALAKLGCNFDCASLAEIEMIQKLGISMDRIIFANPVKMVPHLLGAQRAGVKWMTFDNADELTKISQHYPEAELVLRIITDDSQSRCAFSSKYGARIDDCPALIQRSRDLGLKLIGVSFHVGSGGARPEMFRAAMMNAKRVIEMARDVGIEMTVLDLGGGFPGHDAGPHPFPSLAEEIRSVLSTELGPGTEFPNITVIAEPGRYFVTEAYTLVCSVIGRRVIPTDSTKRFLYYLNDGVYQSFNCIFFDHTTPMPEVLHPRQDSDYVSTIFGPTCDSLDCLAKNIRLPELQIGDWIYFRNMGAYTVAAASHFNGFAPPQKVYYYG